MRPCTTPYGLSANAEAIRQTLGARLRAYYDASSSQALPVNIDTLLQRLIIQKVTQEADSEAPNSDPERLQEWRKPA
jgi:hypothetical protein